MWKCHKCGKPVYFAERKQSLGYDWHPECLRCEECGKRLNPGQHAEHKGVPYCHVPCYGALFGPQLFGHGTRVESHKSFGQQKTSPKSGNGPSIPRSQIENKLKIYNNFFDGKSGEIRSREVNNRLILEGSLRIHWGVHGVIHLKEDDDQRTVVTIRKRNSCRANSGSEFDSGDETTCNDISLDSLSKDSSLLTSGDNMTDSMTSDTGIDDINMDTSSSNSELNLTASVSKDISPKSLTLPSKVDTKSVEWDELDDLLQVERKLDESQKLYQTMPEPLPSSQSSCLDGDLTSDSSPIKINGNVESSDASDPSWFGSNGHLNRSMSGPDCLERNRKEKEDLSIEDSTVTDTNPTDEEAVMRRPPKTGSTAIKRRPGRRLSRSKIKRRCSINGHFYNRETSFFTPPHGSQMSVWVTSLVSTHEVINLLLEKYKVESDPTNFALFIVRDNGEQRRLKEDESPLLVRVLLGPHEDVARLFLMDSQNTPEVSNEVAQFLNLSVPELRAILNQYYSQEEKEIMKIQDRYKEMKRRIKNRMEELKVRL
ncbi:ras association domain-containing protein 2 [Agrilus planipennis]|uniref:Ras association domain-containing protein 2 n=1 Tax=Agrilus planipennis TaxID=224129 RepID=A0A1W4X8N0_AGRPL|nr:ras association domain-containing protein 2 [Agrilus planipennis]